MIELMATIASLIGALIVAQGKPEYMPLALITYIVGSIFWIFVGIEAGLLGLIVTNFIFIVLETIALIRWMYYNKL